MSMTTTDADIVSAESSSNVKHDASNNMNGCLNMPLFEKPDADFHSLTHLIALSDNLAKSCNQSRIQSTPDVTDFWNAEHSIPSFGDTSEDLLGRSGCPTSLISDDANEEALSENEMKMDFESLLLNGNLEITINEDDADEDVKDPFENLETMNPVMEGTEPVNIDPGEDDCGLDMEVESDFKEECQQGCNTPMNCEFFEESLDEKSEDKLEVLELVCSTVKLELDKIDNVETEFKPDINRNENSKFLPMAEMCVITQNDEGVYPVDIVLHKDNDVGSRYSISQDIPNHKLEMNGAIKHVGANKFGKSDFTQLVVVVDDLNAGHPKVEGNHKESSPGHNRKHLETSHNEPRKHSIDNSISGQRHTYSKSDSSPKQCVVKNGDQKLLESKPCDVQKHEAVRRPAKDEEEKKYDPKTECNPKNTGNKIAGGQNFTNVLDRFCLVDITKCTSEIPRKPPIDVKKADDTNEETPDNKMRRFVKRADVGAGLQNLGNTCFVNATVQCLTYTPVLVDFLLLGQQKTLKCDVDGVCVMCELGRHMHECYLHSGRIIKPHSILQKLKVIARHMKWGRQEDAHEFLRYLVDAMNKSCLSGHQMVKVNANKKVETVINKIFGGYLRSQVTCEKCHAQSNTYDPFLDISLDVKNVSSVTEALKKFVLPEMLEEENLYQCTKCQQNVKARKRFTIHKASHILTVQLKRYGIAGGKVTRHINFPENLDLRPYTSDDNAGPLPYRLYGVLVHDGYSTNSGHYYCYIKTSSGSWYCMNDHMVRRSTLNDVLNSEAYLLFYCEEKPSIDWSFLSAKESDKVVNGSTANKSMNNDIATAHPDLSGISNVHPARPPTQVTCRGGQQQLQKTAVKGIVAGVKTSIISTEQKPMANNISEFSQKYFKSTSAKRTLSSLKNKKDVFPRHPNISRHPNIVVKIKQGRVVSTMDSKKLARSMQSRRKAIQNATSNRKKNLVISNADAKTDSSAKLVQPQNLNPQNQLNATVSVPGLQIPLDKERKTFCPRSHVSIENLHSSKSTCSISKTVSNSDLKPMKSISVSMSCSKTDAKCSNSESSFAQSPEKINNKLSSLKQHFDTCSPKLVSDSKSSLKAPAAPPTPTKTIPQNSASIGCTFWSDPQDKVHFDGNKIVDERTSLQSQGSKPHQPCIAKSGSSNIVKSGGSGISKSGSSSATKSGSLSATKSGSSSAAISGSTSSSKYGSLSATKSGSSNAVKSGNMIVAKSGSSSAVKSGSSSAANSGSSSVTKSGSLSAAKSGSSSVTKSASSSAAKSGSSRAAKSGSLSVAKSGSSSVAKSGSLSVAKSGSSSEAKSGSPSNAKSGSPSNAKSGSSNNVAKSGGSSLAKSGSLSDAKSGSSNNVAKSGSLVAAKSESLNSTNSGSSTVTKSKSASVVKSKSTTDVKPGNSTVAKSENLNLAKSGSSVATKPGSSNGTKSESSGVVKSGSSLTVVKSVSSSGSSVAKVGDSSLVNFACSTFTNKLENSCPARPDVKTGSSSTDRTTSNKVEGLSKKVTCNDKVEVPKPKPVEYSNEDLISLSQLCRKRKDSTDHRKYKKRKLSDDVGNNKTVLPPKVVAHISSAETVSINRLGVVTPPEAAVEKCDNVNKRLKRPKPSNETLSVDKSNSTHDDYVAPIKLRRIGTWENGKDMYCIVSSHTSTFQHGQQRETSKS